MPIIISGGDGVGDCLATGNCLATATVVYEWPPSAKPRRSRTQLWNHEQSLDSGEKDTKRQRGQEVRQRSTQAFNVFKSDQEPQEPTSHEPGLSTVFAQ